MSRRLYSGFSQPKRSSFRVETLTHYNSEVIKAGEEVLEKGLWGNVFQEGEVSGPPKSPEDTIPETTLHLAASRAGQLSVRSSGVLLPRHAQWAFQFPAVLSLPGWGILREVKTAQWVKERKVRDWK